MEEEEETLSGSEYHYGINFRAHDEECYEEEQMEDDRINTFRNNQTQDSTHSSLTDENYYFNVESYDIFQNDMYCSSRPHDGESDEEAFETSAGNLDVGNESDCTSTDFNPEDIDSEHLFEAYENLTSGSSDGEHYPPPPIPKRTQYQNELTYLEERPVEELGPLIDGVLKTPKRPFPKRLQPNIYHTPKAPEEETSIFPEVDLEMPPEDYDVKISTDPEDPNYVGDVPVDLNEPWVPWYKEIRSEFPEDDVEIPESSDSEFVTASSEFYSTEDDAVDSDQLSTVPSDGNDYPAKYSEEDMESVRDGPDHIIEKMPPGNPAVYLWYDDDGNEFMDVKDERGEWVTVEQIVSNYPPVPKHPGDAMNYHPTDNWIKSPEEANTVDLLDNDEINEYWQSHFAEFDKTEDGKSKIGNQSLNPTMANFIDHDEDTGEVKTMAEKQPHEDEFLRIDTDHVKSGDGSEDSPSSDKTDLSLNNENIDPYECSVPDEKTEKITNSSMIEDSDKNSILNEKIIHGEGFEEKEPKCQELNSQSIDDINGKNPSMEEQIIDQEKPVKKRNFYFGFIKPRKSRYPTQKNDPVNDNTVDNSKVQSQNLDKTKENVVEANSTLDNNIDDNLDSEKQVDNTDIATNLTHIQMCYFGFINARHSEISLSKISTLSDTSHSSDNSYGVNNEIGFKRIDSNIQENLLYFDQMPFSPNSLPITSGKYTKHLKSNISHNVNEVSLKLKLN